MKTGYIKLLLFCIFLSVILTLNAIHNIFSMMTLVLFLALATGGLVLLTRYEKERFRYKKDIILLILIYSIFYLLITYLGGILVGFNRSGYSLKFFTIIKNITPVILLIVVSEFMRYMLMCKGSRYKSIVPLILIVFILIDLTLIVKAYDLTDISEIIKIVVIKLLPSISKNVFLIYLAYKVGYKPAIIYRLIFEVSAYILPIFPDYGVYVGSILEMLFPSFLLYNIYRSYEKLKTEFKVLKNSKIYQRISVITISVILVGVVILTSGWFKYYVLTIGSGSMTPNINKGDVIIVKKASKAEKAKIKVGEVLIYKHKDLIIVHRVTNIVKNNQSYTFYTKGDNNDGEDKYVIPEEDVIGTTSFRFPYIGWPTVLLNELVQKSKGGN